MGQVVQQQIVAHATRRVGADTLVVIDPTDIRKPYAQAMPHLAGVRDGSAGQLVNSYWACVALACEPEQRRVLPLMKETRYLSLGLCPDIHRRNLEQSLYTIFARDYGIHLTEINQMLSAMLLEGESLKPFQLDKPVPAFRVEGVSFCGKNLIIEMEDSVYRGDIYRFAAKAGPQRRPPPQKK